MFSRYDTAIDSIPTVALFRKLFDNYDKSVNVQEDRNSQEQTEEQEFLDEVMATPVMQMAYEFLNSKQVFNGDRVAFQEKLTEIWFDLYSRASSGSALGSSGMSSVLY